MKYMAFVFFRQAVKAAVKDNLKLDKITVYVAQDCAGLYYGIRSVVANLPKWDFVRFYLH